MPAVPQIKKEGDRMFGIAVFAAGALMLIAAIYMLVRSRRSFETLMWEEEEAHQKNIQALRSIAREDR